jgi:hypothetical protein
VRVCVFVCSFVCLFVCLSSRVCSRNLISEAAKDRVGLLRGGGEKFRVKSNGSFKRTHLRFIER